MLPCALWAVISRSQTWPAGWLVLRCLPIAAPRADGVRLHDPGLPARANQKFIDVTGYTKADCAGRNCRFLQGPGTNPEHGQHLLDTLRRGEDSQTMLLNYRKSGEPFENLLTMRYVHDSLGRRAEHWLPAST